MSTHGSPENGAGLPPVALIAGPTASGKSDIAVRVALALRERGTDAVIINADSAQVYADLAVLSARPSKEEMQGVEHRLFGAWDGASPCSAADWAAAARREIAAIHADGGVPILVGGTGLYIRTLLEGIAPIPPIAPEIRQSIRALPVEEACWALQMEDPDSAARLNPGDKTRIARALEVVRSTGKPLAFWQGQREGGIGDAISLRPLLLLPERAWLYDRCDRRFALMMEHGAAGEVAALLNRQLPPDLPVMRAIGVREIGAWMRGEWSRDQAMAEGQQATRNYAKRQYTWFRGQCPSTWTRIESSNYDFEVIFDILFHK